LVHSQTDAIDPNETSGMIAAAEVLILIGENGGDPIFAHIAIIRALRPREPRRHLHCAVSVRSDTRSLCDQNPDGPPIDEADHFYRTDAYNS
jgi:hypothetical protein